MSTLTDDEALADADYGFPSGTMQALGMTESSNGTNLGTIGNVFQVLPSTAANPGYGLSSVDGNSAVSSGAYLSALVNGPANGDLSTGLAMYQGGAANPTPYGSSTPISKFLSSLGYNTGSTANPVTGTDPAAQSSQSGLSGLLGFLAGGTPGGQVNPAVTSSAQNTADNAASGKVADAASIFRILIAIGAILVIGIGLAALALKSDGKNITIKNLKQLAPEAALA